MALKLDIEKTDAALWADVMLPLNIPTTYTYFLPENTPGPAIQLGVRVQVAVRNKEYSGIVVRLFDTPPDYPTKPILAVLDEEPVLYQTQIDFWRWLAQYYCCNLGDVMNVALPAHLKISSETAFLLHPDYTGDALTLSDNEYLVTEALQNNTKLTLKDIQQILQRKVVEPIIRMLLEQGVLIVEEGFEARYKPKMVSCLRWAPAYVSDPASREKAFSLLSQSEAQTRVLMAYMMLSKREDPVRISAVLEQASTNRGTLNKLAEKGIIEIFDFEISRIGAYQSEVETAHQPDNQQIKALSDLKSQLLTQSTVLLHGVTGSGKTMVYSTLMEEVRAQGGQVLYLLPEIALSVQLTQRLRRIFGDDLVVYHSRISNNERVELWRAVYKGVSIVLGVRSALLLPFKNLRLIIVDEEHDFSYKQSDPAPRYQARDAAIYLAGKIGAQVVLGSATPSIESYYNAQQGKYGLVQMLERHGGLALPLVEIVDLKPSTQQRSKQGHFSNKLLEQLKLTLEDKKQVILFQNRRGFAPTMHCTACGWKVDCINCDVSLTYHKHPGQLSCHYCGYTVAVPHECKSCGSTLISYKGFGTERIEDEIGIYFPEARIDRLDLDTTRSKMAHSRIFGQFEAGDTDILVGTQMVTKGLDFDNVALVGVISADSLFSYPDFRATERAFQLLTQVAGRAGRKNQQGLVLIQAYKTEAPVLQEVIRHDYARFFKRELAERQQFRFPPFVRIVQVTLKHSKADSVLRAARIFADLLRQLPSSVVVNGPITPMVERVNNMYLLDFQIKMPKQGTIMAQTKAYIQQSALAVQHERSLSQIRIVIDVDPYG